MSFFHAKLLYHRVLFWRLSDATFFLASLAACDRYGLPYPCATMRRRREYASLASSGVGSILRHRAMYTRVLLLDISSIHTHVLLYLIFKILR